MASDVTERPRVLHIARNFPNVALPRLGLWTDRLVRAPLPGVEAEVIAPVPYWPPIPGPRDFTRYLAVPPRTVRRGVVVHHPRFVTGPGNLIARFEGRAFASVVAASANRIHRLNPVQVIHAHFVYPEGWAALRVARNLRVPFVITEHASWEPWLDRWPLARRRAVEAARASRFVVAVSHSLATSISHFVALGDRLRVIPNVVEEDVFTLPAPDSQRTPNRLVFVGLIRRVKGLDVLLDALRLLVNMGADVHLAVVGDSFYSPYKVDEVAARRQVEALQLGARVTFLGGMDPPSVVRELWRSDVLVLPSRREAFGAVLAEALACGLPVVATRCGGPEDIVTDDVGRLVDPENPLALATGIAAILKERKRFEPTYLRSYALSRFSATVVGARLTALYAEALT